VDEARKAARRILAQVELGGDPHTSREFQRMLGLPLAGAYQFALRRAYY
jgi:hypothetical protein